MENEIDRETSALGRTFSNALEKRTFSKALEKSTYSRALEKSEFPSALEISLSIAGAATAVSLGALAFYAYHKLNVDISMIVEQKSIQGIAGYGAENIRSAVRGLEQIDRFMSGLNSTSNLPTMGDFFNKMKSSGVDPAVFKSAVSHNVQLLGVKNVAEWTEKLTNPATVFTPSVQARVTELVWYHDKQVAMHAQCAQDAAVFVKTGLSGLSVALAGTAASLINGTEKIKEFAHYMLRAARRVAVIGGLISDADDHQIRKSIQDTNFDPIQARARIAMEYTERQTPMFRSMTQYWLEASRSGDRSSMPALFELETKSLGKHTAIGQAVMMDHFGVNELLGLADLGDQGSVHVKALKGLAKRKSSLQTEKKNTVEDEGNSRFVRHQSGYSLI